MESPELIGERRWVRLTGDPVLDWALGAEASNVSQAFGKVIYRAREPQVEGERAGRLAKAVHRLGVRPPIHPNCHCSVRTEEIGGERWEILEPLPTACPVCKALAAERRGAVELAASGREETIADVIPPPMREVSVERFQKSLRTCPRPGMLQKYTPEELGQMKLY